jgi:hypothetical protein
MKIIINKKILLEEMRAIDRRQDALSKGIIPHNDSNWNADRKNPKKIQNMNMVFNNGLINSNTLMHFNNMSPRRESFGIVNNNIIHTDSIGKRSVNMKGTYKEPTIHNHPVRKESELPIIPRNIINSFPSGTRKDTIINGDLNTYRIFARENNSNRKDYIISPHTKAKTLTRVDTNRLENIPQKISTFSNTPRDFDLNGNLKSMNDLLLDKPNLFQKIKSKANSSLGYIAGNIVNTGFDKEEVKLSGIKKIIADKIFDTSLNFQKNNPQLVASSSNNKFHDMIRIKKSSNDVRKFIKNNLPSSNNWTQKDIIDYTGNPNGLTDAMQQIKDRKDMQDRYF